MYLIDAIFSSNLHKSTEIFYINVWNLYIKNIHAIAERTISSFAQKHHTSIVAT